jgi:hypothetical protein
MESRLSDEVVALLDATLAAQLALLAAAQAAEQALTSSSQLSSATSE